MKTSVNCTTLIVCSLAVVTLLLLDYAEAKRGCAAFGHACYGGHGRKRSNNGGGNALSAVEDAMLQQQQQQEGGPSAISDGQGYYLASRESNGPDDVLQQRPQIDFSPFFRQWLQSYKRSQQAQILDNQL